MSRNRKSDDMLDRLLSEPYLKPRMNWKIALCQHPMYLLVDEDRGAPPVGERVLPWGAPDATTYVERVKRNLASLDKYPDLKLNYEFSAVELDALARAFPDVAQEIRQMRKKGSLDFVNGSFSQAHLQTFSSESNWRQFEMGLAIFQKLFGKRVRVYAAQETGMHQQLPQLLKQFGYEMLTVPSFPWTMEILEGNFEVGGSHQGMSIIARDEFVQATALDGTCLPMYLNEDAQTGFHKSRILQGIDRDLFGAAPVWMYFPDLIEVDNDLYRNCKSVFDFVLLEEALKQRVRQAPPRAKARVYTYWSYMEGVWAEELLRKNKEAEEIALLTEAMCCMSGLAIRPAGRKYAFRKIWHTILKYQHHDVYWIEVTDLRRKAISYLDEGIAECRNAMARVGEKVLKDVPESIALFNGLSRDRKALVTLPASPGILGPRNFQRHGDVCRGFVKLPAGGFRSFKVSGESAVDSQLAELPKTLRTKCYGVEFSETGLILQIVDRKGNLLLKTNCYLGGELRAMIAGQWYDNRRFDCRFYHGPVFEVIERAGSLGPVPVRERYFFFHHERPVRVELEFDFNANSIGHFWFDETKLNVYYPTHGTEIYHDIPFGYIRARELRPLFPINWVYCGGLAYVNRGTVKHWIKDGVIANVLAWGGTRFDNRMHFEFWTSKTQYDLRLYGKQKIEYYLLPYGKFDGNAIVREVDDLTAPVFIAPGAGHGSFYRVSDKNLFVTAVYERKGEAWVRGYQLPSRSISKFKDWEIFNVPLQSLTQGRSS